MTEATLDREEFVRRAGEIRLLVLDVDGVLADGGIVIDGQGGEIKRFCVRDGFAIRCWREAGHRVAILSGRTSAPVAYRARALGIENVVQGSPDKEPAFRRLLAELAVEPDHVCVMGDDLPDLPLMLAAGLGVTVADAAVEVRRRADWISRTPGGRGAVRELIEELLKAQGLWDAIVDSHCSPVRFE